MEQIIRGAVDRGASDIHIRGGDVIRARIGGKLLPLTKQKLSPEQARAFVLTIIAPSLRERVDVIQDHDCSWGINGVGRFRVNVMRQRGSFVIVLRVIPYKIPTLDELGLPPVAKKIALAERGLVLVTGVTGSGKSSTMAGMIQHQNQHEHRHIVTLEDPIEFLHSDNLCAISQREIGSDTDSFHRGLRAALRQDPDVIQIGEMRDSETIDIALKAAETGHLVISTVHTKDATNTVARLISAFPPEEQETVRYRLADALHAVVSQRLLARKDRKGRALAAEVMVMTSTIRDCVIDPDKTSEIRDHIAAGRDTYGMQTFDQHLADLVASGAVDFGVARAAATNPGDFDLKARLGESAAPSGGSGAMDGFMAGGTF
ncbi:type IV pilus twitching motility protein PilT [Longimicrobium terrae]|uniref:Twitching motility protein PilT n=1 Tax=Longimicrobium terrae TaxID=1639882 RepID=A0A841GYW7_9BACT|nr:PilT/PilU family type 4a pilus ATPase [Longimicrobium terrae]MBB4636587.1 twitching motility protein PilT [Longimicrobium terrae]MBB6070889.1 twitching motility protein PilT [Longimicrobium terrae]NNC28913.1 PilT/PilU family type 4a pilus ATPase [Longimicrobium terrae]